MIRIRRRRTLFWCLILGGLGAALRFVEVEDRVRGPFLVRAARRADLRAPVAGFLHELYVDEGDRVSSGMPLARLEISDLASRRAQKRFEVQEAEARLRLLEVGTRPDEVAQQRLRVERAQAWRDLAAVDLKQSRRALDAELARLDQGIAQHRAELDTAENSLGRMQSLAERGAVADEQLREAQRRAQVARAGWEQSQAQKRYRAALGTRETFADLDAESELARRAKDLADAGAQLSLLEVGSRPEDIDAQRAQLARLREEACYLDQLEGKLLIRSPLTGLITTPRLRDKRGQYLDEGDLICVVEDPSRVEAEILLWEQDADAARTGRDVALRARAFPTRTFRTVVTRSAPTVDTREVHNTVTVYCDLANASLELRPGMSGYARIYTGQRPIGEILGDRALRYLRTEFWFWSW